MLTSFTHLFVSIAQIHFILHIFGIQLFLLFFLNFFNLKFLFSHGIWNLAILKGKSN
uniref:Uncharacterized protein n=1 Tax=Rhizophora mucronata TaxID=61149 RepID=A0A2P2N279_RHIMU